MHLTVKLGTVPINFEQSMKLNINVVGKKRYVEQDRRTCIWPDVEVLDSSLTIHCFTLDYPTAIVGGHPIRLHQLREVLHLPTYPLLLLTSSILRKSDARIPIPIIARLDYTISTHCIASWLSSQAYFSKVDGYSHSISNGRLHRMCQRRCDWSKIMSPFYR